MFYHPSGKKSSISTSTGLIKTDEGGAVEVTAEQYATLMKTEFYAKHQEKVASGAFDNLGKITGEIVECTTVPNHHVHTSAGTFQADKTGKIMLPIQIAKNLAQNSQSLKITGEAFVIPPTPEAPQAPQSEPEPEKAEEVKASDVEATEELFNETPEAPKNEAFKKDEQLTAEELEVMELTELKAIATAKEISFDKRFGKEKMIELILASQN